MYYFPNVTFGSLTPGTDNNGKPVWSCNYIANGANIHQLIRSVCPTGYSSNILAPGGCSAPPAPKTQGSPSGCVSDISTSQPSVGNPIVVCTGNKYEQVVDFRSAGTNVLEFVRYYNSQTMLAGVMGTNWQNNWERQLIINSSTLITVVRPDGQQLSFTKSGGNWIADSDVTPKLAASGTNYTLTLLNGTIETYDSTGNLTTVAQSNGYTQTLTYTTGKLTSVTDNQNRTLTFSYDTNDLLVTMTDPDGNIYTYTYALAFPDYTSVITSKLISVIYPSVATPHPVLTYLYEDTNFPTYLTGIIDELGNRIATWTYDAATGQATQSEHAGGADLTSITYNADGTKTVTFPLGEQIKYTFATVKNAPKVTREDRLAATGIPAANRIYTYDGNGFLASKTDWDGNKTTFVNNSRGLQTSRTEAVGTSLARTITTTWHATLNVPTQIVAPRKTTDFTYDSGGNMLTRTETDTTTQSVPYSTNGQTRTWTYTYDALGHVLTVTGPRTDLTATTTYTYDTSGNISTITDALSHVTTVNSYNNRGLPTQFTDPNGVVTVLTYDPLGRLLTHTVQASGGNAVTNFYYNNAGLLTSIAFPDKSQLTYGYDTSHRLTSVTNKAGESINYTLDTDGNVTQQVIKTSGGSITNTQSRVFDIVSRLKQIIGASGQTTTYGYDSEGNRTSINNALNDTTAQAFDALNRLITVTDPLTHATGYGYNTQDSLTSVTDPRTLVTSYVYDGFGQVIQEASPDRGTTVYVLDKAGNVTQQTDARGIVTNRTFDALNRVTAETFPASTGENIAYTYDATAGGNKGIGRLTGFTDESGSTTLDYDERGNVVKSLHVIGAQSYKTIYAYNLSDRLTQITYPSGHVISYTRGNTGNVTAVTYRPALGSSPTTVALNITYKPFGPLSQISFRNNLASTYSYDQDYRLTGIVTSGAGTNVQNLTIAYNGVDDITSITDNLDSSRSQTFTYDKLYRLTQAAGNYGTVDYTYDADGNRLTRATGGVTQTSTYPSTSNKVSSITNSPATRSFTYDANGNSTADDRSSGPDLGFAYSNRNRNKQALVTGGVTANYLYNALGQRAVKSIASGSTTHYQYDQSGHLIAESDGATGAMIREYVWLEPGQPAGRPLVQVEPANTLYYIHTDHLDTPQKITNAAHAIVWDRQQQPFGEQTSLTGTITSSLRFPGQQFDAESALNYNMMRDYDPTLGRYIEPDPIGLAGGSIASMGLYGYANQNALKYMDPWGLQYAQIGTGVAACLYNPACVIALSIGVGTVNDIIRNALNNDAPDNPSDDAKKEAGSSDKICTSQSASPDPDNENDPQKKGRPGDQGRQNKQVNDAANQAHLDKEQRNLLGRIVERESRQYGANLSYQDILEIARDIANGIY